MTGGANEHRPSSERVPSEALYDDCCNALLVSGTYSGDAHYRRFAIGAEEQVLVHDYNACSTRHWDYGRSQGWGADLSQQRELLERRQTVISFRFERSGSNFIIFRPDDLDESSLLGQAIIYGYYDYEYVPPAIDRNTYNPNAIMVVANTQDGFTRVLDPLQDPQINSFMQQLES